MAGVRSTGCYAFSTALALSLLAPASALAPASVLAGEEWVCTAVVWATVAWGADQHEYEERAINKTKTEHIRLQTRDNMFPGRI